MYGQPQRAARLCGAGQALRDAVGVALTAVERRRFEATMAAAQTRLGEAGFAAALAEGQALGLAQAVELARGVEPAKM